MCNVCCGCCNVSGHPASGHDLHSSHVMQGSRTQDIGLSDTALNKPFMEVDGIGQLSRFHRIINYGTQIVSLKKSQSAANIWNFP